MPKPPATFSIKPLVRIVIRGRRTDDGKSFPPIRDNSLLSEFHEFERQAGIYPAVREGTFGAGIHIAYYTSKNAEKIHRWLREHGAKRTEFMG